MVILERPISYNLTKTQYMDALLISGYRHNLPQDEVDLLLETLLGDKNVQGFITRTDDLWNFRYVRTHRTEPKNAVNNDKVCGNAVASITEKYIAKKGLKKELSATYKTAKDRDFPASLPIRRRR
ncbi:MAG: hypothetical protein JW716_04070 [Candidatus Aenigmarchaeota archaeon]|nr:hypothetical protein [Candidatus Aenigmarchaeota archaeon]